MQRDTERNASHT